jgi:hypothetical protein
VEVDAARSTELALGPWTSCEARAGAVWGSRRVREAFRGLEKNEKSRRLLVGGRLEKRLVALGLVASVGGKGTRATGPWIRIFLNGFCYTFESNRVPTRCQRNRSRKMQISAVRDCKHDGLP